MVGVRTGRMTPSSISMCATLFERGGRVKKRCSRNRKYQGLPFVVYHLFLRRDFGLIVSRPADGVL